MASIIYDKHNYKFFLLDTLLLLTNSNTNQPLYIRLLDVIENDILPKTRKGVAAGNKVFGAAILNSADLSLVIAGTNQEIINPIFHGEIATLNSFYQLSERERQRTNKCIFLSTHEPCSLCLSAITFAGFKTIYYFFAYEDTRNEFNIPHDLDILREVFNIDDGNYKRKNCYWTAHDLGQLIRTSGLIEKKNISVRMARINQEYKKLSKVYQKQKLTRLIPLD